jgi:hypothetical protein
MAAQIESGAQEAQKDHDVTIIVDGKEHRLERRHWIVRDLKVRLRIDPAKVLAKITPHGLKDLGDNEEIELHDGERFMTHARSGGSS